MLTNEKIAELIERAGDVADAGWLDEEVGRLFPGWSDTYRVVLGHLLTVEIMGAIRELREELGTAVMGRLAHDENCPVCGAPVGDDGTYPPIVHPPEEDGV